MFDCLASAEQSPPLLVSRVSLCGSTCVPLAPLTCNQQAVSSRPFEIPLRADKRCSSRSTGDLVASPALAHADWKNVTINRAPAHWPPLGGLAEARHRTRGLDDGDGHNSPLTPSRWALRTSIAHLSTLHAQLRHRHCARRGPQGRARRGRAYHRLPPHRRTCRGGVEAEARTAVTAGNFQNIHGRRHAGVFGTGPRTLVDANTLWGRVERALPKSNASRTRTVPWSPCCARTNHQSSSDRRGVRLRLPCSVGTRTSLQLQQHLAAYPSPIFRPRDRSSRRVGATPALGHPLNRGLASAPGVPSRTRNSRVRARR